MRKTFLITALACQLILGPTALSGFAQQATPTPQDQEKQTKSPAAPQEQTLPSDEDVVKITTNLVQVDAVITDKKGMPVTDLRADEVQIFEDGHQQKVTHFSFVAPEVPLAPPLVAAAPDKNAPPLPPSKLHPEDVRRTIALVVDDLGLSFESTNYVRNALKKFVDQQMQPGDLVAIIRTSGGIGALQQFTADKRQLYAAIERVKWYLNGRSSIGAFAPMQDTSQQNERQQAFNEDFDQFREDAFAVGTLGAVGYVVKGMHELPGRKSILLISDGVRIYSRGDPDRNYRALMALRRLIDQANRATVVIYTMNAKGLQTLSLTAADATGEMTNNQIEKQLSDRRTAAFESQEGLDYLASQTGGLAIRNTNDLSGGIRRVVEDQKSYYLIGYRPDDSTFDAKTGRRTFHKLTLKVLRPGKLNVRMRNGFYGVADDALVAKATTPRQQIINALTSPFGAAGVRLRLTTLFANDAKTGSYMRSLLHVNASDLTFADLPDGSHKADFDVVALTFGDNGNIIDQVGRTYTMRVSGDSYQRVRRDGFVYFLTVPIKKAGAYQLRAALRDHTSEHVGSASQFIEVPDIKKNRLVASGILLTTEDPKQPTAANKPPEDQSAEASEKSNANSAARRQFARGEILDYSFELYNARLEKATGQPHLSTQMRLFRDAQQVFAGKELVLTTTSQRDLKRIIVGGAIRLGADMMPGEYVLQITATDPLADEKHRVTTQWIDFEIVK
jgi:VWFA-related protein